MLDCEDRQRMAVKVIMIIACFVDWIVCKHYGIVFSLLFPKFHSHLSELKGVAGLIMVRIHAHDLRRTMQTEYQNQFSLF